MEKYRIEASTKTIILYCDPLKLDEKDNANLDFYINKAHYDVVPATDEQKKEAKARAEKEEASKTKFDSKFIEQYIKDNDKAALKEFTSIKADKNRGFIVAKNWFIDNYPKDFEKAVNEITDSAVVEKINDITAEKNVTYYKKDKKTGKKTKETRTLSIERQKHTEYWNYIFK